MQISMLPIVAVLAALPVPLVRQAPADSASWQVLGVELPCRDVERAASFYRDALGYVRVCASESSATLRLGEVLLVLTRSETRTSPNAPAQVYLNHHVPDLNAAAAKIEQLGGTRVFEEPRPFVLGDWMVCRDLDGNTLSLVRLSSRSEPALTTPEVFNLSITSPARDELGDFFCDQLGFEVYSRDYLPKTLPLKQKGSAMLVLHMPEDELPPSKQEGSSAALLLAWPNETAAKQLGRARSRETVGEPSYELRAPGGLGVLAVAP